ncbi:MAG TPA: tetratricopeptide repeat protein, partial [Thermoanaerobaculia bacterium]|nr:tetratricopeptide repeat protein [Thermoanaerobaculia bacterium]
ALDALEEQMRRSPGNAQVALSMATILLELKRFDDARKHAEIALASAPAFASELLAQIALSEGNLTEAERQANAGLALDPRRVQSLMVLSQVRDRQGRFDEELALLDRSLSTVQTYRLPAIRELQFRRGQALLQLRRAGEAEAAFRAETESFADNLDAWASLALVMGTQGRKLDARAVLEAAMKRNPGSSMRELAVESLHMMGDAEGIRLLSGVR